MRHAILPSMCAVAVAASCSPTLAQQAAPAAAASPAYLNTERGLRVKTLEGREISPSLMKGMRPEEQITKRTPGVPTRPSVLLQHEGGTSAPGLEWFAARPLKMMPYLDSSYVFGNTCAEPNAWIREDMISTGAQKLKTALSRYGITYSAQFGFNYTGLTGGGLNGKTDFPSYNGSLLTNITIFRNHSTGSGLYLASEFDFGNGFDFNEGSKGPKTTLGSLQNPTSSFQGPDPHLSNLSLAWVGAGGKLLLMAGQLDTTNYMDHNAYANSHNNNLTNSVFGNNPVLPLTDNSLGFHFAWQPTTSFYVMGATAANNMAQNHNPFRNLNSDNWTNVLEFGYVAKDFCSMGPGVYRLQPFFTTSNGENGGGVAVNFQQQLGRSSHLGWFFRGGWASDDAATLTGVRCAATTGLVLLSPFRGKGASNDGYLGLGFLWQQGAKKNGPYVNRNEYGIELTYVAQVTPTMTLQPDIQLVKNPVNGRRGQTAVVFQIQNVWSW